MHELVLYKIKGKKASTEINKILGAGKSGKILKVFVRFAPNVRSDVHLRILTREGEEIINIHNMDEVGNLFYPRVNVDSRKYGVNRNSVGSDSDYIYFIRGMLLNIKKNNPTFEGVLIEKIRIVYQTI